MDLTNPDGLVRRDGTLTVVRNLSRVVTTLRVSERASDPNRVLTTAKTPHGCILYVDSHFDEPVAAPPYEVRMSPFLSDRSHRED